MPGLNPDGSNAVPLTADLWFRDVNDAPDAVDNSYTTNEDMAVGGNALTDDTGVGVDSDLDGDAIVVDAASVGTFATVQGGSITIAADGTFTYTPALNFNGADSFAYTITDGSLTDTATLTFTVTPVNDAPDAIDNGYTTNEDTAVGGNALTDDTGVGVDSDLDGDALVVDAASVGTFATVQGGSITIAADGTFTYTPAANFNGVDSFAYTITDGSLTDTATLTFTVTPVNDAPEAVDNAYTTNEDTAVGGNALTDDTGVGVDSDLDGDAIVVDAASVGTFATVQGGSITIAADGSFTYTPALNFNGVDSFAYIITDGALTDTATLTFTVTPVNDAPDAVDNNYTTNEDMAVGGNALTDDTGVGVDSDLDGDAIVVDAASVGTFATVQGGSITIAADGTFTYTPAANFNGVDSFAYTITDGSLTDTATLTFTVTPVNDAPDAIDNAYTTNEDTAVGGNALTDDTGVGVDSDLDGDALVVDAASVGTFATVQGGSITIAADGSFTYTPALNFNGVDSFAYTITDGALTDTATLTFTVTPVNDAPDAIDNGYTTNEDTAVGGNALTDDTGVGVDSDLDGDAIVVDAASVGTFATVQGGSITIAADGTFTYTPAANFNGVDSFAYTITDGALTDTATLTFTVTPVNDAPDAVDNNYTTNEDMAVGGNALTDDTGVGVDSDLDGDALVVDAASVGTFATVQGGSITIAADGTFTYTPAANFNGVDSFAYTITDGALTDTATLAFTVTPVNDAPDAVDNSYTTNEDTAVGGNALTDDTGDGVDSDLDGAMRSLSMRPRSAPLPPCRADRSPSRLMGPSPIRRPSTSTAPIASPIPSPMDHSPIPRH